MSIFELVRKLFIAVLSLNTWQRTGLTVAAMIFTGVGSINFLWGRLFAYVDAIVGRAAGTSDFSGLSFINYVVPLDTMCDLLVWYAGLRLACAAVRIIKSFIPTIA